jgi:SAM-dependent methyltransferase
MHLDVQDLKNFYYRQSLGRAVQRVVRKEVVRHWPDTTGQTVVGFGFAVPLLRPFLAKSRRVIALMPGPQGVMHWPAGAPNVSVISDEFSWPLETGHVDRLILFHGLENCEHPAYMLEEARRVLGPGGRVVFIVPNRAGIWSRTDATPFGFGRPYSLGQLETQLRVNGFSPERHSTTLFALPTHNRSWQKTALFFETIGPRLPFAAGGLIMVEASKRANHKTGTPVMNVASKRLGALSGLGAKQAKPVISPRL